MIAFIRWILSLFTKETKSMSTLSQLFADAPAFLKIIQDGIAVEQSVAAKGFLASLSLIESYQADFEAALADIEAFFVAKAVAKGTVTAVPAA